MKPAPFIRLSSLGKMINVAHLKKGEKHTFSVSRRSRDQEAVMRRLSNQINGVLGFFLRLKQAEHRFDTQDFTLLVPRYLCLHNQAFLFVHHITGAVKST